MIYSYVSSWLLATFAITLVARWCMAWQSHGQPVSVWRQVGLAFLLGLPIYLVTLVWSYAAELRAIDSMGLGIFVLPPLVTVIGLLPATVLAFWQRHPWFGLGVLVALVVGFFSTEPVIDLVHPFVSDRPVQTKEQTLEEALREFDAREREATERQTAPSPR